MEPLMHVKSFRKINYHVECGISGSPLVLVYLNPCQEWCRQKPSSMRCKTALLSPSPSYFVRQSSMVLNPPLVHDGGPPLLGFVAVVRPCERGGSSTQCCLGGDCLGVFKFLSFVTRDFGSLLPQVVGYLLQRFQK